MHIFRQQNNPDKSGLFVSNQEALGKGGHHLVPLGPSTHPNRGRLLKRSRSVTHLTTYGGPLVKGVSMDLIVVVQKQVQKSGG